MTSSGSSRFPYYYEHNGIVIPREMMENSATPQMLTPQSYIPPPGAYNSGPPAKEYSSFYQTYDSNSKGARRAAFCFAFLFIVFLLSTIGILVAWAILTDGFRNIDQRERKNVKTQKMSQVNGAVSIDEYDYSSNRNAMTYNKGNMNDDTEDYNNKKYNFNTAPPFIPQTFPQMCLKQECTVIASEMVQNMDKTVSPCDDFFQFACGGYIKRKMIPSGQQRIRVLYDMEIDLSTKLKVLLEAETADSDPESWKMARILYKSCMDVEVLEELGLKPITELIQIFGNWPVLGPPWSLQEEDSFNWERLAGQLLQNTGTEAFVSLYVQPNLENATKNTLVLDQPKLILGSKDIYMKGKSSSEMKTYLEYMVDVGVMMGADKDDAKKEMEQVLDLEMLIANASKKEEDRFDGQTMNKPMKIGQLKEQILGIDWDLFLKTALPDDVIIDDNTVVNLFGFDYITNLPIILQMVRERAVANYLIFVMIDNYLNYLPNKYKQVSKKINKIINGVDTDTVRWKTCIDTTVTFLGWPLSSMFVKTYFKEDAKIQIEELVKNLGKSMDMNIKNAEWMDSITKNDAKTKLAKMEHKIGYPDYIFNEDKILNGLKGVTLETTSLMGNVVQLSMRKSQKSMRKLNAPVDKEEWDFPLPAINAYYHQLKNEIVFPAGILQPTLFIPQAPGYINYASIGMVIGHEITHAFDDSGRQYDGYGNLRDWWSPSTLRQFTRRADCITRQYSAIVQPVTRIKLNGKLTLQENIADNGGLRIAFQAYKLSEQGQASPINSTLPGLTDYTSDQLFFLSFANNYCEKILPDAIEDLTLNDVHSLGKYRTNVPLQNMDEFSEIFRCPTGSVMNPTNKCKIW